MKRIFLLFLSLALLFCAMTSTSVLATGTALPTTDAPVLADAYAYAITPDSKDWFTYSVKEKVAMLKIQDSELESMTDSELVGALASYPYLVDIYLYGSGVSDGIEVVRTYCSALDELLNRDTGLEAIRAYLSDYTSYNATTHGLTYSRSHFSFLALSEIFFSLSSNDLSSLSNATRDTRAFVSTDCGSRVEVRIRQELHDEASHFYSDRWDVMNVYDVEYIETGSCLYNCHAFAWYMEGDTGVTPLYWMNDPALYMTDGSYERVYSGSNSITHNQTEITNGDIIFYGDLHDIYVNHSAICVQSDSASTPLYSIDCISKWGTYGVFKHALGEVPDAYDQSVISAWRFIG